MRKIITIICVLLVLTSCTNNSKENNQQQPSDDNLHIDHKEISYLYEKKKPKEYVTDHLTNFSPYYELTNINNDNIKHGINSYTISDSNNSNIEFYYIYLKKDSIYNLNCIFQGIGTINFVMYDEITNEILINKNIEINEEYSFDHELYTNNEYYDVKINIEIINMSTPLIIKDLNIITNNPNDKVNVNQLGYNSNSQKMAMFNNWSGNSFDIYNLDTNDKVYTGNIVNYQYNDQVDEVIGQGDFTNLTAPGRYKVVSQFGHESYEFSIDDNIYKPLISDAIAVISKQRCGTNLSEERYHKYAHESCHTNDVILNGEKLSIIGGWHDASDYGRYTNTISKTLVDLMFSYMLTKDNESQDYLLDEIKYGLDYLINLINGYGGFSHKIVSKEFAGNIMPDEDESELYAMNVDTASSAFATGLLILGSNLFESIDLEYSMKLKEKALIGKEFIDNHGLMLSENPGDFNSGVYKDEIDLEERYFMYMCFYYVIKDTNDLDMAINIYENNEFNKFIPSIYNPAIYGSYLYTTLNENKEFNLKLCQQIVLEANYLIDVAKKDPYLVTLQDKYFWSSNTDLVNNSILMMFAYLIDNDNRLYNVSSDAIHYVLGRNSLDQSFISGYGDKYPVNIHHRVTEIKDTINMGALVGGPNRSREDRMHTPYDENTPNAKNYLDHVMSYSTNEITIYYNSSLVLLLSGLNLT